MNKKSGIYKITINEKCYVGSTVCLERRKNTHFSQLKNNKHCNSYLQNVYNKHQEFSFEVLEYCEKENLIEREQFFLDTLNPEYNIRKVAESNLGLKLCKERKKKISDARKGKTHSSEARKKMSLTVKERYTRENHPCLGKILSDETKKKNFYC